MKLGLTSAVCFLIAQPAVAAMVVDQSNNSATTLFYANHLSLTDVGQSFTPLLNSISYFSASISSYNAKTAQATLYSGSGYTGSLLSKSDVVAVSTSGLDPLTFTFATPVSLTAGASYTVRIVADGYMDVSGDAKNSYSGGMLYEHSNGDTFPDYDLVFSEGYTTSGVPEPAMWAMMIAGFGAVGAAMRRRKVQVIFG